MKDAVARHHSPEEATGKRTTRPDDMLISPRVIHVPISTDPSHLDVVAVHECEVMMTADDEVQSCATTDEDPPGLAILDSGCTKTMHGADWAARYEDERAGLGSLSR